MDLREQLCGRYCSFYKPSRDEAVACGGYRVIEKLSATMSLDLVSCAETSSSYTRERISAVLCAACPFYRDDCDFARNVTDAPPCGGLIAIASLVEQDSISIDDLLSVL
ncbi:MAG: hypothetical protein M0Z79_09595 [Nitrospiraceae bacterium]|nr:hypothetical protein [Nitrospiraceae bacterium]